MRHLIKETPNRDWTRERLHVLLASKQYGQNFYKPADVQINHHAARTLEIEMLGLVLALLGLDLTLVWSLLALSPFFSCAM